MKKNIWTQNNFVFFLSYYKYFPRILRPATIKCTVRYMREMKILNTSALIRRVHGTILGGRGLPLHDWSNLKGKKTCPCRNKLLNVISVKRRKLWPKISYNLSECWSVQDNELGLTKPSSLFFYGCTHCTNQYFNFIHRCMFDCLYIMLDDSRFYVLFNSIIVISRRLACDTKRLSAMEPRLR